MKVETLHNHETSLSIKQMLNELCSFGKNDLLVQLNTDQLYSIEEFTPDLVLDLSAKLLLLFKKSYAHFRETGSSLLCISQGEITWKYKGEEVTSPLFLHPLACKVDKVKHQLRSSSDPDEAFVNPFLQRAFDDLFEVNLNTVINPNNTFEVNKNNLEQLGFTFAIENQCWLGNFHHYRFEILRDLELLQAKGADIHTNIKELLSGEFSSNYQKIVITPRLILPSDDDQTSVLKEIANKNIVVQGPPGTGKSQLITNLISKTLFGGYKALVMSEKRVALVVLADRLKSFGLDRFAYIPETEKVSHSFIQQLKDNWTWMEGFKQLHPHNLDLSDQKVDALQFKMDILSQDDLIGGVSYTDFQKMLNNRDMTTAEYTGYAPSIVEFEEKKSLLNEMYALSLHRLSKYLPRASFLDQNYIGLENNIALLEKRWNKLKTSFEVSNKKQLGELMKQASFAQMMTNELHQPYFKTLNPNKNEYKRFGRLYRSVLKTNKSIEAYQDQLNNWKTKPTKAEAQGLLKGFEEGGLLQRFKAKRKLNQLLVSPFIDHKQALAKWIDYCELRDEKVELETKLLALGVQDERQLDWVFSLQLKLRKDEYDAWRTADIAANTLLANHNAELHVLYQNIRAFINIDEEENISAFFETFRALFPLFLEHRSCFSSFSELLYQQIGNFDTINDLELSILRSNWVKFIGQFSAFQKFEMTDFNEIVRDILHLQDKEQLDFSDKIKYRMHQKWNQYQKLLLIGTKKLKLEDRIFKEKLKAGRSILIKEFGKTRSHPTIRELMETDARIWIEVLMPIWMLNPAQVATFFPMDENQFDFLLVDEATQVPLSNSLGALHRSKRVMIVGDSQQMTPQSYFKAGDSEPIDLLHQASYTWEKLILCHHYRSESPQLIAFSNKHFYDHKLIPFPAAKREPQPMQIHWVKNGRFIERKNKIEAQRLVEAVRPFIHQDFKIGIVAFSETQLEAIRNEFSKAELEIVDERAENGSLFMKALENIQGDECDKMFISLGYGYNEEGKLLLNFGPMNRKSGSRRLNVLLTRARKSIDFFTSIQPADLVISQNDSLNLLRQFLQFAENELVSPIQFPYNLSVEMDSALDSNVVRIVNVFQKINKATELLMLHRVLESRGWQVVYQ